MVKFMKELKVMKTYEQKDHQLQLEQNAAIKENTRITWLTLWIGVVVGLFSLISAIADSYQAFIK